MTRRRRATSLWASAGACIAGLSALAGVARAAGESHYGGDLGQALAAMAVFLVLLLILGKYAWRPIVQQLKKREEAIQKTIDRAERTRKQAKELLAGYEEKMAAAQAEVAEMLQASRQEAGTERKAILQGARDEAQRIARAAREDISRATEDARRALQTTTAELAAQIAGQVLGQSLTDRQQQELIDQSLHEIRRQATKEP